MTLLAISLASISHRRLFYISNFSELHDALGTQKPRRECRRSLATWPERWGILITTFHSQSTGTYLVKSAAHEAAQSFR